MHVRAWVLIRYIPGRVLPLTRHLDLHEDHHSADLGACVQIYVENPPGACRLQGSLIPIAILGG